MIDSKTIENYKKVDSLVKKYFSLTDESQALFSKLLFEPEDGIELSKIASQPDRRLFIETSPLSFEKDDVSWKMFKEAFPSMVATERISYQNYIEGKVGLKKITTVMVESIVNKPECFVEMLELVAEKENVLFSNMMNSYFPTHADAIIGNKKSIFVERQDYESKICIKVGRKSFKKKFNPKEVTGVLKEVKTDFSALVNRLFFGVKRTNAAYLCFSLNFADWLLASTGEEWTSCIGLENDNGYWRGLASLIGDKNRILVYVTNKQEKEFMGVKSYKMIERSWAFLYKDFLGRKIVGTNRVYPQKNIYFDMRRYMDIFEGKDITYEEHSEAQLTSLYKFPTIFYKPLKSKQLFITTSIYEDTHSKEVSRYNIAESYYDKWRGTGGTSTLEFLRNGTIGRCEYLSGRLKK